MNAHAVGILLTPQFSNLALGLIIEPMVIANWLSDGAAFEWVLISEEGGPVSATNGMTMATSPLPAEPGAFATIFVVASFEAQRHAKRKKIGSWLRRQVHHATQVAGIETGTEILAAASLLDGQPAAVHWDNLEGFAEAYPKVKPASRLYTISPSLMTCAGGTATLDLMLDWISRITSVDLAKEVSQHLICASPRSPHQQQSGPAEVNDEPRDAQVRQAIGLMQESLESPMSCEAIAAAVGLSKRQLERKFRLSARSSPARYYLNLRLALAHKLLQQTELSVSEVAAAAGFGSFEHFSRVYKTQFDRPPSADRMQSWDAPVMRHRAPVAARRRGQGCL